MANSTNRTDMASTTFTRFPSLPPEIRDNIWEEACLLPRVVDLQISLVGLHRLHVLFREATREIPFRYKSRTPPPAVLHASQASRKIALKHYSLAFGTKFDGLDEEDSRLAFTFQPKIYINWRSDIVCPIEPDREDCYMCEVGGIFYFNLKQHKDVKRVAFNVETGFWLFHSMTRYAPFDEIFLYYATYAPTESERSVHDLDEPLIYECDSSIEVDTKDPEKQPEGLGETGISPKDYSAAIACFKEAWKEIEKSDDTLGVMKPDECGRKAAVVKFMIMHKTPPKVHTSGRVLVP
ncbi:hypothetical protein EG329_011798 [Mollisiaceae sp. DMI_Dod_QoI]|nr:hypothetical protein EG329_011798 [Helotiales sp. DMI_Dod_QoI]